MRIEQLTFTRFFAAIAIVIFHFGRKIAPFNIPSIAFIFQSAGIGVSYFFILSGFVMMIAYQNKSYIDAKQYFKNRFARVYPVYLLAIVLLFIYYLSYGFPFQYTDLILNLIVVQAWIPGKALSFNFPAWSLSVELLFYSLFPFLFNRIYTQNKIVRLIVPILTFWLFSQVLLQLAIQYFHTNTFSTIHDLLYYFPLVHLNQFLVGNLAGIYYIHYLQQQKGRYDWLVLALILVNLLLLKYPLGFNFHDGLLAIIFVPLIITIALNNGFLTQLSNLKIPIYLGEISYGIYILQSPIYNMSNKLFDRIHFADTAYRFYVFVLLLIILSGLSFSFIETPLRKWIKTL